jgi:hypothetical protein
MINVYISYKSDFSTFGFVISFIDVIGCLLNVSYIELKNLMYKSTLKCSIDNSII